MKRTIVCEMSHESVAATIKALREYGKWRERKMDEFVNRLAEYLRETAQQLFGSAASVTIQQSKDSVIVSADGDAVCFIEFGTGVGAEKGADDPYSKVVPFDVIPGSWSEQNADTWNIWVNIEKKPKEDYPYNHVPKMPMFESMKTLMLNVQKLADEVFHADN